jgi:hypothetical protein
VKDADFISSLDDALGTCCIPIQDLVQFQPEDEVWLQLHNPRIPRALQQGQVLARIQLVLWDTGRTASSQAPAAKTAGAMAGGAVRGGQPDVDSASQRASNNLINAYSSTAHLSANLSGILSTMEAPEEPEEVQEVPIAVTLPPADEEQLRELASRAEIARAAVGSPEESLHFEDRAEDGEDIIPEGGDALQWHLEIAGVSLLKKEAKDTTNTTNSVVNPGSQVSAVSLGAKFNDDGEEFSRFPENTAIIAEPSDPAPAGPQRRCHQPRPHLTAHFFSVFLLARTTLLRMCSSVHPARLSGARLSTFSKVLSRVTLFSKRTRTLTF